MSGTEIARVRLEDEHPMPLAKPNAGFDLGIYQETARIAEMACKSSLLPEHLQNKPADCLLVFMQAHRWKMDPFAVAQCSSIHGGKLMYEGKLVHAALLANGGLKEPFDYEYSGSGDNRQCTVIGILPNGKEKRHTVILKNVRTIGTKRDGSTFKNAWDKQPDQQLAYRGARDWARLYAPGIMLGVVTDDESLPVERESKPARVDPFRRDAVDIDPPSQEDPPAWQEFFPDKWQDENFGGQRLGDLEDPQLGALWRTNKTCPPLCAWVAGYITKTIRGIPDYDWSAVQAELPGTPDSIEECNPAGLAVVCTLVKKARDAADKVDAPAAEEGRLL